MPKKKSRTYVEPRMKFNVALEKFEPDLSADAHTKAAKTNTVKTNDGWMLWAWIIIFLIVALIMVYFANR